MSTHKNYLVNILNHGKTKLYSITAGAVYRQGNTVLVHEFARNFPSKGPNFITDIYKILAG